MGKFNPNSSENDSNSTATRRVRRAPAGGAAVSFKTIDKKSINRPDRKRLDQLRSYAGRNRSVSLTERAILNDGFGKSIRRRVLTVAQLAERLEISKVALVPHLDSLIEKGEVVAVHEPGRVRYRRRVVA